MLKCFHKHIRQDCSGKSSRWSEFCQLKFSTVVFNALIQYVYCKRKRASCVYWKKKLNCLKWALRRDKMYCYHHCYMYTWSIPLLAFWSVFWTIVLVKVKDEFQPSSQITCEHIWVKFYAIVEIGLSQWSLHMQGCTNLFLQPGCIILYACSRHTARHAVSWNLNRLSQPLFSTLQEIWNIKTFFSQCHVTLVTLVTQAQCESEAYMEWE